MDNSDILDLESILEEDEDTKKQKFICLFSDGVSKFDTKKYEQIKSVLLKKKIDLMVFNVPNQNANTLYLKLLTEATPNSQFFTSEKQMLKFF